MMKYILTILLAIGINAAYAQDKKQKAEPFMYVEQMPEATYDVHEYIMKHFKYPKQAIKDNVSGRVTVKFIVTETGAIKDATIIKRLHPAIDKEMLRVVKTMPQWKPGKQNGRPVPVYYTLPMTIQKPNIKK